MTNAATIEITLAKVNTFMETTLIGRLRDVMPYSLAKINRAKLVRLGLVTDVETLELTAYGREVAVILRDRLAAELETTRAAARAVAPSGPVKSSTLRWIGWSENAPQHP